MATQLDFATRQLANPSAGVQQSLHDLGAMFGQFQQNKLEADKVAKEEARYQTELARQKVLDDRATELYNQQKTARDAEMKVEAAANVPTDVIGQGLVKQGAGLSGAFQGAMAQQDVVYQNALKQNPKAMAEFQRLQQEDGGYGNVDAETRQQLQRTDMERALQATGLGQQAGVDAYKGGTDAVRLAEHYQNTGQTLMSAEDVIAQQQRGLTYQQPQQSIGTQTQYVEGSGGKVVTTPGKVLKKGTPAVAGGTVEDFFKSNPTIQSQVLGDNLSQQTVKGIPVKYTTNNFVERNPTEGDGSVFSTKATGHQSVRPSVSLTNLANKLADTMPMTSSIINTVGHAVAGDKTNLQIAREKVMSDPSMYTQRPASSVKDPNAKGKAYLAQFEDRVVTSDKIANSVEAFGKLPKEKQLEAILKHTAPKDQSIVKAYFAGKAATPDVRGEPTSTITKTKGGGYTTSVGVSLSSKGNLTTPSGNTIKLGELNPNQQGVITKAYEQYAQQARNVGIPKSIVDATNKTISGILKESGVTRREANVESILKAAHMDGSLTASQDRELKLSEGRMNASIEQYKSDVANNHWDADFKLKERIANENMMMEKLKLSVSERQHRENRADKKTELSAFEKAQQTSLGRASVDESSPKYKQEVDKSIRESIRQQYTDKYGEENFWNPSLSDYMDTGVTKYYTDQAARDKAALMKAKTNK